MPAQYPERIVFDAVLVPRTLHAMVDIEVPVRAQAIADHKRTGGLVAAVFPVHYPRALLRAHGILPVEVWGPPGMDTTEGDAHLQAYTCSIVRSALAFVSSAAMAPVDLALVPHACDSLQGLGSLLIDLLPTDKPVLPFYPPRAAGAAAVSYLAAEIGALGNRLAELSGVQPDAALLGECIEREERADELLGELSRRRPALALSDAQWLAVARSREYLPAEHFTELCERALGLEGPPPARGVPLLVSGMLPEPSALLGAVADAGGWLAAEDLACFGRRLYARGQSDEPLQRMAESLMSGAPDPTLGSEVGARARHLWGLCERGGARAVIFWVVKFCEPELFYLPQLRKALERRGLPSAVLEVDVSQPLPAQLLTRLEALLEMAA